jgi:hypothetical protein
MLLSESGRRRTTAPLVRFLHWQIAPVAAVQSITFVMATEGPENAPGKWKAT